MASAAGFISAQWNGADTFSIIARLAPLALAISTARSTADLLPDTTTCPPPLSLATSQTSPCAASAATAVAASNSSPSKRRHRAGADRHRLLHGAAANAQKLRGVGDGEGAGRRQRRIFAERMAGDELRVALEIDAGLRFEHAHRRERNRHQRRLRVLGEGELVGRPVPHGRGELFAERRVDLVEHRPRRRKSFRQRLAHADRLAALARKYKGCRHCPILSQIGPKGPNIAASVKPRGLAAPPRELNSDQKLAFWPKTPINPAFR